MMVYTIHLLLPGSGQFIRVFTCRSEYEAEMARSDIYRGAIPHLSPAGTYVVVKE